MYTTLNCFRASDLLLRCRGGSPPKLSFRFTNRCATMACYLAIIAGSLQGQGQDLDFKVTHSTQRLEMIVNTSRILATDTDVPRVLVNNPDILRVVPLAPRQIQVSALKPGVTQVNLWGPDGTARTVDIAVFRDSRQLELVLQAEFPKAAIRVRPLENSVILSGDVDRPEIVSRIVSIAQDYYPNVINNVNVGGVHQVLLHTKVMEVSRTKLRSIGMDWGVINGGDFLVQGVGGLVSMGASNSTSIAGTGQDTIRLGILNNGTQFTAFIDALRQHQVIKVLAEPTLTAISGRPATFNEGGEFPILVPQGLGQTAVEFKQFGTRVDFVPIVLGNNSIRLEVRPQVSEIDNSRSVTINGVSIPGLRTRFVDTGVEMRAGQTLALAGLIQTRTEGTNRGLPWLSDLPWAGNFFGRHREEVNEIELLVTVRPELVSGLDPHEAPTIGPGQMTTSPNDVEFYGRGYTEVPQCCPQQGCAQPGAPSQVAPVQGVYPDTGMTGPIAPYAPQNGAMGGNLNDQEMAYPENAQPMPMDEAPAYQPIPEGGDPNAPMMNLEAPANTNAPQGELFGPSGYDDLN